MAVFAPSLQVGSGAGVGSGGGESARRLVAGDSGLRVRCYGGDCTGLRRLYVVCSTSSRSRGASVRRSGRSPNHRNRNGGGSSGSSGSSKPVSVLPGDINLLRDLQEFICSADLPPHQVPSTRELARRGRQDLANAVRRRGEKALSQLLSNPNFSSNSAASDQPQPSSVSETSNGICKPEVVSSSSGRAQGSKAAPLGTDSVPQSRAGVLIPHYEAAVERSPSNFSYENDRATLGDPIEVINPGFSSVSLDERKNKDAGYERGGNDEDGIELYTDQDASDDGNDKWARLKRIESSQEPEESGAWQKAAMLRSKLTAFFDKPVERSMAQPRSNLEAVFDIIAKQRETDRFLQLGGQDNGMLPSVGADPAAEIARLTSLLHAKEMENLRVTRVLEETKAMLALVRAKQSAELAQSKQLAVEKDLRLHAAEQALHSLRLTKVDWWGEGNRVELAGSFNGWQHHAYLLPDLSSRASQMPGTCGPLLWRVELWLYPGVYEIKFIVDGKWVLDDRREIVLGHMGENNLLYVES